MSLTTPSRILVTSKEIGLRRVKGWIKQHPFLAMWFALAAVMVAVMLYSARQVDLLVTQRSALVIATILLAGACVWIITWE